jgi:hypothetical protein
MILLRLASAIAAIAHPEGERKLAGGANHRIDRQRERAPKEALGAGSRAISAAPSGAVFIWNLIRWFPLVPRFTTG